MVYGYIKLAVAHAFAAEDSHLVSEMQISLAVQKWTELARLPYWKNTNFTKPHCNDTFAQKKSHKVQS